MIDIINIAQAYNLQTGFQPIISIKRKAIIGFEALTRGMSETYQSLLPYDTLHDMAESQQQLGSFDSACQYSALQQWNSYRELFPEALLFINFDMALINSDLGGYRKFIAMLEAAGLSPGSTVIELVEQKAEQEENLLSFVEICRRDGFLLAIDDFGEAFSNLERLFLIQPDIIKISKKLLHARRYSQEYGQSVLKGVAELISSIGAMPLLEGVEDMQQLSEAVDCNIDVIQGFLVSRPIFDLTDSAAAAVRESLRKTTDVAGMHRMQHIQLGKIKSSYFMQEAKHISMIIEMECVESDPDVVLSSWLHIDEQIECMYLLSEKGIQITETHFGQICKVKNALFRPARKGDDHSEKDYFLYIKAGSPHYYSPPYISQATGSLCITISVYLSRGPLSGTILCIDFRS